MTDSSFQVVFEVGRFVRRRDGACHRRMSDEPFQEKLRPGSTAEFRRPFGQRFCADPAEKIAAAKWPINNNGDLSILRQRQNTFLGFTLHERIVDLKKIEALAAQDLFE